MPSVSSGSIRIFVKGVGNRSSTPATLEYRLKRGCSADDGLCVRTKKIDRANVNSLEMCTLARIYWATLYVIPFVSPRAAFISGRIYKSYRKSFAIYYR